MLSHDLGRDASHPASSCREVFETAENAKDGKYYVNQDGKVTKKYCARQTGRVLFTGSCSRSAKGSGWSRVCLDRVELNLAEDYLSANSNGVVTIKKDGVYRITGVAQITSNSRTSHHGRIKINGKTSAYTHQTGQRTTTEWVKYYAPLKKGSKVEVSWHAGGGSGRVKYAAATDADGVNRVQIDYIGQFADVPLFSAGCNGHARGGGWHLNCFNSKDWTPAPIQEKYFSPESSGAIIAKVSGFYHIQATNMMHSNSNSGHGDLRIGGSRRTYVQHWVNGWKQLHIDMTYWVNAGQRIEVKWHAAGGNPYWHHSKSSATGHNRVQVLYLGGSELKPFAFTGYCPSHGRHQGWRNYCLSKNWANELGSKLSISSNGEITVKQSGIYRLVGHGLTKAKSRSNVFTRILVDGTPVSTETADNSAHWIEQYHDYTLPLVKGQKVRVQYMATNFAFHAGPTHSLFQILSVDRK